MKHEIPFRINVANPLAGVTMMVQNGKDDLLPPSEKSSEKLFFDFDMTVDMAGDAPNFLGKFAQGPKDARFIYVNSGTYAGQQDTCWARRAKLSLMGIGRSQVEAAIESPGARFEVSVNGVGRDGGPVCASIKGLEWKVVKG